MKHRNYLQEIREEREREEQHIKKILKFYNSSTKINAKLSDIKTNAMKENGKS